VHLHAREHHTDGARGVVLLFHGNGELVADYDGFAPRYRELGFDLIVIDYRGYGQSEGWPTFRATVADTAAILTWVEKTRCHDGTPLVVLGRSLGSACAAEVCRLAPSFVSGVVIESGIGDLEAFVARRGVVDAPPLTETDRDDFDPLRKVKAWTKPLLVMHGSVDTLIAPREAKLVYEAAPEGNKQLVYIEGHGHNDVLAADAYWNTLGSFLDACVEAA